MSDHGRIGNNPMNERKIHTMLMICGKGLKPVSVNGIFSLVQFPDLIRMLIEKDFDWSVLEKEYTIIENLDAYGELIVRDTLAGKLKREEMCQCRGIITKNDAYYIYVFGKEYYFEKTEPNDNKLDRIECSDRINVLRELCGSQFIDIYEYDKFKLSRLLYN